MIGASDAFPRARNLLSRFVRCEASVLIEGETGTGKACDARPIHYESQRSAGPFIPVNCGAIPDSLLESELFGHRQGAFTGAKNDSPGILRLAHSGTLFLDEVDSLSHKAQVALLRFLQERVVRPLGSGTERKLDVRIVSASNRPLETLFSRSIFRQDLYYRLKVMYVELPPLRARGDDVLIFAEHFLAALAARYGRPVPSLDLESQAWLLSQAWQGNV